MDTRELHPEPTYCDWCGEENDSEGSCKAPEHCPPQLMDCPVCIDYGKLSGHEGRSGLECDTCDRTFSFYQGVLTPDEPIVVTDDDIEGLFSRFSDAEDKMEYWNTIKGHVMKWEQQNNG
jgi:hypothetical protein